MTRLHLYYTGNGIMPPADVARIRNTFGVKIVNDRLPRSVVVDVDGDIAKESLKRLPRWSIRESQLVSIDSPVLEPTSGRLVPHLRLVVTHDE